MVIFFLVVCCGPPRPGVPENMSSSWWPGAKSSSEPPKLTSKTSVEDLWFIAAVQGRAGILKNGLEGGLLDIVNADGATALHVCALHGHIDCVRVLLQAGANVSITGREGFFMGKTSFAMCTNAKIKACFTSDLFQQVALGNSQKVRQLVDGGLSVGETDATKEKFQAIHWAANFGGSEVCLHVESYCVLAHSRACLLRWWSF